MTRKDEPQNEDFQTQAYWDQRYAAEADEEDFDWFKTYDELRPTLDELIPLQGDEQSGPRSSSSRILMLGCGNSTLSDDMTRAGYEHIMNVDYSPVLIEKMQKRFPQQDWRVMDVRQMLEPESLEQLGGRETWDVIIDKGTMDALMAEKGSVWDPSDAVRENVRSEMDGVLGLLKPKTGIFIYLTWMQPHFRLPYIERPGWTVETRTLGDAFHYFLYIARKH